MRKVRRKTGGISFITAMICITFIVIGIVCLTKYANIHRQKERLIAENSSLVAQSEALSDRLKQIRVYKQINRPVTIKVAGLFIYLLRISFDTR